LDGTKSQASSVIKALNSCTISSHLLGSLEAWVYIGGEFETQKRNVKRDNRFGLEDSTSGANLHGMAIRDRDSKLYRLRSRLTQGTDRGTRRGRGKRGGLV